MLHSTEPDMVQMEPSGEANFCLQIITDLNGWEVSNHFFRLEATFQLKRDGELQFH